MKRGLAVLRAAVDALGGLPEGWCDAYAAEELLTLWRAWATALAAGGAVPHLDTWEARQVEEALEGVAPQWTAVGCAVYRRDGRTPVFATYARREKITSFRSPALTRAAANEAGRGAAWEGWRMGDLEVLAWSQYLTIDDPPRIIWAQREPGEALEDAAARIVREAHALQPDEPGGRGMGSTTAGEAVYKTTRPSLDAGPPRRAGISAPASGYPGDRVVAALRARGGLGAIRAELDAGMAWAQREAEVLYPAGEWGGGTPEDARALVVGEDPTGEKARLICDVAAMHWAALVGQLEEP